MPLNKIQYNFEDEFVYFYSVSMIQLNQLVDVELYEGIDNDE